VLRNNLRKIDLINNLSEEIGFSSNYSKKIINDLIEIIIQNIKKGDLILKNLGTFKIRKKKERIGRNPKTKEKFIIFERNSVVFIPSKKILNMLNKN
tara:strand:- start:217 stop:507 length:291 start_codon:yes stop_codon:yes gene_type:complete